MEPLGHCLMSHNPFEQNSNSVGSPFLDERIFGVSGSHVSFNWNILTWPENKCVIIHILAQL